MFSTVEITTIQSNESNAFLHKLFLYPEQGILNLSQYL